jgi:hypothetical protein
MLPAPASSNLLIREIPSGGDENLKKKRAARIRGGFLDCLDSVTFRDLAQTDIFSFLTE